jgi:hypothetical protein
MLLVPSILKDGASSKRNSTYSNYLPETTIAEAVSYEEISTNRSKSLRGSIKIPTIGSSKKNNAVNLGVHQRDTINIEAANSEMKRFGGKGFSLELNCFNGRHSGPKIMSKTTKITPGVSYNVLF